MKVILKEKEYEYLSDYPEGWLFSSGDYFKFPVAIGNYKCFVKRFQKKTPHDISGWGLLNDLKAKYEPNLPRIHDIVKTEEKGREIYYVFYELLDGNTLNKLIPEKDDLNLQELTENLFTAIHSLSEHDYWFADFCEKNIFCTRFKHYFLVDLDSTYPVTAAPDKEMYGSKDYWILVIKFYQQFLNAGNIKESDFNGITFNYLQIVFLILRLKLYYTSEQSEYNDTAMYDRLPAILNNTDPGFKQLFSELNANKGSLISTENITRLKELVLTKILSSELPPVPTPIAIPKPDIPIIVSFSTRASVVGRGEPFELTWEVKNADKVELHRNRSHYKDLHREQTKILLTEFNDGSKKEISYELVAYKDSHQVKSNPIFINLKSKLPENWWVYAIVIVIIALTAYFIFSNPSSPPTDIKKHAIDTTTEKADTGSRQITGPLLTDTTSHYRDTIAKMDTAVVTLKDTGPIPDELTQSRNIFYHQCKTCLKRFKVFSKGYKNFKEANAAYFTNPETALYQKQNTEFLSMDNTFTKMRIDSITLQKYRSILITYYSSDNSDIKQEASDDKSFHDAQAAFRDANMKYANAVLLHLNAIQKNQGTKTTDITKAIVISKDEFNISIEKPNPFAKKRIKLKYPANYDLDSVVVILDYRNCGLKEEPVTFKNLVRNIHGSYSNDKIILNADCNPTLIVKKVYLKNKQVIRY